MTDQEAIAKAQKELDMANYFAETSPHAGLRTVHSNRAEWLTRVLHLARKGLDIEENQKKPKTNADRIRAMSDDELAKEFADCAIGLYCDTRSKQLPELPESVKREVFDSLLEWLKQPAEDRQ